MGRKKAKRKNGGHRATPPSSKNKGAPAPKLPPSRLGSQCEAPKSATPSESSSDSDIPDNGSMNMDQSRQLSQTGSSTSFVSIQTQSLHKKKTKTPLPPPIAIPSKIWRKAGSLIFENPAIQSEGLAAKLSTEGIILLKTVNSSQFRQVQKCLLKNSLEFHTYNLPTERQLKVVLRSVPTKVPTEEVKSQLEQLNFDIKLVRKFGAAIKPMPICLVILSGENAKDIFQLTKLFDHKITVESFRKSGPSQCHNCQGFGHGSTNCRHPSRCVKCAGNHPTKECKKTRKTNPKCANCGAAHTANYHDCPFHTEAAKLINRFRAGQKQANNPR